MDAFSSSRSFCESQTSHKWLPSVTTGCCKGREPHSVQSPGAVVSTLPDETLSSRGRENSKQVSDCWDGNFFVCAVTYSCSPACWENKQRKGQRRGNARYLQPAAGANSAVWLYTWRERWRDYVISVAYHNNFQQSICRL